MANVKPCQEVDANHASIDLSSRKDFGNKATIGQIVAANNWLCGMTGDDVSTIITVSIALSDKRKQNAQYRAEHPPQPKTEAQRTSIIQLQKERLMTLKVGVPFTEDQVSALESNGVLGTDECYKAIGSIMRNDANAETSRKSLLAKAQ